MCSRAPPSTSRPPNGRPTSSSKAELDKPLLVLVGAEEIAALKSFRNLAGTRVLTIGEAEVQDYVWAKSLLFTEAAVSFLEGGLSEGGEA